MKRKIFNNPNKLKKCLLFFGTFLFSLNLGAQSVSWLTSPASPSLSATVIGILSEEVLLDLRFTYTVPSELVAAENLKTKSIQIELPAGVSIASVEKGTQGTAGFEIVTGTVTNVSGTVYQIPITSITYNRVVHLIVRLRADACTGTVEGTVGISLSNGAVLSGSVESLNLNVVKPNITASPVNANPAPVDVGTAVNYQIPLSVSNGVSAQSMTISITKDRYTTLSDFLLGAKAITSVSQNETEVVLNLSKELVGATPVSAGNPQTLSFNAVSSVSGERSITAKSDFPASEAACISNSNLFNLKLTGNITETGEAFFTISNSNSAILTAEPFTGEYRPLAFNASNVNYYCIGSGKNTGKVAITQIRIRVYEGYTDDAFKADSYIDETLPIYYAIMPNGNPPATGDAAIKAIDKVRDNCQYFDKLPLTGHMRLLKEAFKDKYSHVQFNIPEPIPSNHHLFVYIPHVTGQTYDNSDWVKLPVIYNIRFYNIVGNEYLNLVSGWDINGNALKGAGSLYIGRYELPNFTTAATSAVAIKAGQQATATIPFGMRGITGGDNFKYIFYARLPLWLELDGIPTFNGLPATASAPLLLPGEPNYDTNFNTYRFYLNYFSVGANLVFNYKAKGAGEYTYLADPVNATLQYWIDWDTGYNIADNPNTAINEKALRPIITYVTKTVQEITCTVSSTGVRMDDFRLNRLTRGLAVKLKDASNTANNRTPDNAVTSGGSALEAATEDINHETYLPGDEGEVKIAGEILDAGTYKYLYVLLSSDYIPNFNFTKYNANLSSAAFPGGSTYQADAVTVNGNKLYVRFSTTGTFPAGNVNITVPFEANSTVVNMLKILQAEVYAAPSAPDDPFNPGALRVGKDLMRYSWRVHTAAGTLRATTDGIATTIGNAGADFYVGYFSNSSTSDDVYRYPNEYRPYWRPQKVRVTLPESLIPSGLKIKANYKDITTDNKDTQTILNTEGNPQTIRNANGTVHYDYDISGVFDFTADSYEKAEQAKNEGKWIAPDDGIGYYVYVTVKPLPILATSGTATTTFYVGVRPSFSQISKDFNATFVNNATRSSLNISASNFTAYDPDITVTSIVTSIIHPTNTSAIYPAWLYIDGDVSNIALRDKSATPTTPTIDGKWISLGNLGPAIDYELRYSLNSTSSGTVNIYLIADFDSIGLAPSGDIATFIANPDHTKYIGGKRSVSTPLSSNSVLQGKISVPSENISFGTPYEVTVSMDSKNGEANVINPVLTLEVPEGQQLVRSAGSLQYQDPFTAGWVNIPDDAISEIDNRISVQTSKFTGNDFVLYGNKVTGKPDTLNLKLMFNPDCTTSLSGFKYRFSISGKNLLGENATGVNNMLSNPVYTNIASTYYFSTNIAFDSNNSAFGGHTRQDMLLVTVMKYSGDGDMIANDSLQVTLPRWLNLSGEVSTITEASELAASLNNQPVAAANIRNTVSQNTRTLRIPLPVIALNGTSGRGFEMPFTYRIPLAYTEESKNPDLQNAPRQEIRTNVYTDKQFSDGCSSAPFPLGGEDKTKAIALLTLSSPNPYLYNMLSLGENSTLEITSDGFEGSWYSNANLQDTPLSTTSSYSFKPTVPGTKDLYVSAIFSGTNYGKIYLPLKTPPIDLYWRKTGAGAVPGVEWLNPENWEVTLNGNDNNDGYLPALSTVVTLPSKADWYPVLTDTVACHIIRFEHGAALIRQDLLIYDSARVQLNVEANRWYMFSPPLHNMYSGDFYNTTPNPFAASEQQTTYTMLYNANNPETDIYQSGAWTGVFNTPNRPLHPGSGIAFWVDKHSAINYTDHPGISFAFPKNDVAHYLYNPLRPAENNANISSPPMPTDRPQNGRFIYE
ncbi:MAG: hypothetical protein LBM08_03285, partial [Dysgonamonadaceae bacterium]|nr:hypothetical protein [Dysgonamonadaceae bacterium]